MLKIKQIVNEVYNSNSFLLFDNMFTNFWLFDVGDVYKIIKILPKYSKIKGVFLTHTHFDHIYGINDLLRAFPDCSIYTSEYGSKALFNDRLNFSYYRGKSIVYQVKQPYILKNNDIIELFPNCYLQAIDTPGHCPSCLTYIVDNYIFTGDSYIPGIKVVTNVPKGNKVQAQESVEKILKLSENKIICAGHGAVNEL